MLKDYFTQQNHFQARAIMVLYYKCFTSDGLFASASIYNYFQGKNWEILKILWKKDYFPQIAN